MRVLIHSPGGAPLYDPALRQPVGGMETRAATFARRLAEQPGIDVTVVVESDEAGRRWDGEEYPLDGIRVINRPNRRTQLATRLGREIKLTGRPPFVRWSAFRPRHVGPVLRLALGRLSGPRPAASDSDPFFAALHPDWALAFGVNRQSAGLIHSVPRTALMIASDHDLDSRIARDRTFVTRQGEPAAEVRNAICDAAIVFVQSTSQQVALKEHFARDGVLLPNPVELSKVDAEPDFDVLWIGRADRFHKRPLLAVEAAAATPELTWRLVLAPGDADVAQEVVRAAPANVTVLPPRPFAEMPALFAACRVFVSTSDAAYEGVPNVVLQAAAAGRPSVTTGAAVEFLQQTGRTPTTPAELPDAIRKTLRSYETLGRRARDTAGSHYESAAIAAKLVRHLRDAYAPA